MSDPPYVHPAWPIGFIVALILASAARWRRMRAGSTALIGGPVVGFLLGSVASLVATDSESREAGFVISFYTAFGAVVGCIVAAGFRRASPPPERDGHGQSRTRDGPDSA